VVKAAERDRKHAEKKTEEEAKCVVKAAERDRKHTEKEAEEEAKHAAKAAEHDANDAAIVSMNRDGFSYAQIASKLGNGLKTHEIYYRWKGQLEGLSGIIKPAVQPGVKSSINWTTAMDAVIVRMRTDDISFAKIASKLGNSLTRNDILNRWNRQLKNNLQ